MCPDRVENPGVMAYGLSSILEEFKYEEFSCFWRPDCGRHAGSGVRLDER